MQDLFLELFNLAISAGWLALAILLLRLIFRQMPKGIRMGMWALLGLRLCLPFSLESALSLIPSRETLPPEVLLSPAPEIESGIPAVNAVVNPIISGSLAPKMGTSVNPIQIVMFAAAVIWVVGVAAMLLYGAISWLRLRRRVRVSVPLGQDALLCDSIDAPFIFGLFRPRIYLPSGITEPDAAQVLLHERAHLARRDHIWKPLGFLLLSVYWFHPVFWFAFRAFAKDIEYACDARVIRDMDVSARKSYSEALLAASARRYSLACPLAFGEEDVRGRLSAVLSYKKPAFWLSLVGVVLCAALAVGFLTDPVRPRWQSDNVGVTGLTCSAECTDVVFTYEYDTISGKNPQIGVRWENNTAERTICFEESYYYTNRSQHYEGEIYPLTAQTQLGPGGEYEEVISLADVDISAGLGEYQLVRPFWFADDPGTTYRAYIKFRVGSVASFLGKSYSFDSSGEYPPQELSVLTLYVPEMGSIIYLNSKPLGGYNTYTELTKENFDLLFAEDKQREARILRRNNNIAAEVYDYEGLLWYLLEQKNGDIWLIKCNMVERRVQGMYQLREQELTGKEGLENDPWGITMEVLFGDKDTLNITLHRDGTVPVEGKLITGPEFQIFRLTDGKYMPCLPTGKTVNDTVLYDLPESGELTISGDLNAYTPLLPGTYGIAKSVRLEKPDGSYQVRTYTSYFAILGEIIYD